MNSQNPTIMQYFEWYLPDDCALWNQAAAEAGALARAGVTALWLPPAYKGAGGAHDVGYAVYDLYDLGEFDQKGSVRTKYGTRQEYLACIEALHAQGLCVYPDVVLNHHIGADASELVPASSDDPENRNIQIGSERVIRAWTRFDFVGRGGKYSNFTWNWAHFAGVDWDDTKKAGGVYKFHGKHWDAEVDSERGNFDYLMGADVDFTNPQVLEELERWGQWYLQTTKADGMRLDALKHIRYGFYQQYLGMLRSTCRRDLFAVGEYWSRDVHALEHYLDCVSHNMRLFDVPLHFAFYEAATANGQRDMARLFEGTLTAAQGDYAVTFVDNHDTQIGQALESFVPAWFKPLAYALILLRKEGVPCVFYGDYYGIPHDNIPPAPHLKALLWARMHVAYGFQHDYFDHANIVGWTREGDDMHPSSGLAAVLSDGPGGSKRM
nr:alpha-amylase [Maliibacterium massiliense]